MKKRKWSSNWSFYSFLVLLCCHGNFTDNIPKNVVQHAKDVHLPPAETNNDNLVNKDTESSSSHPETSLNTGETGQLDSSGPEAIKLNVFDDIGQLHIQTPGKLETVLLEKPELPVLPDSDEQTLASSVNPKNVDIKDNIPSVLERLAAPTEQCSPLVPPLSTTDYDLGGPPAKADASPSVIAANSFGSPAVLVDAANRPESNFESIEDKLTAKFASVLNRSLKADTDGNTDEASVGADAEMRRDGLELESGRTVDENSAAEKHGVVGGELSAAGDSVGSHVTVTEDMPSFSEWAKKRLEEHKNGLNPPSVASQQIKATVKQKMRHKNYASLDCGAKVLTANGEAQSTSAVLSHNRDDYMLNPCTAKIWLVIELCESIQADRIELANYELFSSTPREFSVYSSDRYPSREWALLGKFEAKDERTVQSFNLEHSHFGKFIKVELVSHYGSEHFCLLSLVRVYGTSEYEALDTDDAEASGAGPVSVEEEDDGFGTDSSQESQNLFGSAKDAVMNIVKKYTEALRSEKNGVAPSDSVPNLQVGSDGGAVLPTQLDSCYCLERIPDGSCRRPEEGGGVIADGSRSSLTRDFLLCHYPELLDILQSNGDLHLGMCASVCHILTEDQDEDAARDKLIMGHRTHRTSCGFHLAVYGPVKFGALCRLHELLLDEKRGTLPTDRPRCTYGNVTVKPSLLTMDQLDATLKAVVQPELPASESSLVSSATLAPLGSTTDVAGQLTTTAVPFVLVSPYSDDPGSVIVTASAQVQHPAIQPTKTLADAKLTPCRPEDGVNGGDGSCAVVAPPGVSVGKKLDHTAGQWPEAGAPAARVSVPVVDGSPRYPPAVAESPAPISGSPESSRPGFLDAESLPKLPAQQPPPPPDLAVVAGDDDATLSVLEGTLRVLGSPSTSVVLQKTTTVDGSAMSVTILAERKISDSNSAGAAVAAAAKDGNNVVVDNRPGHAGAAYETEVAPTAAFDSTPSVVTPPLHQQLHPPADGASVLVDGVSGGNGNGHGERPAVVTIGAGAGGMVPGQKESVFVRLSNRIKALELNMSLSSQYLEELSRRYRKQMEEMQRTFNKTIGALNESARLTHERDLHQQNVIELLQAQLVNISLVVDGLQQQQDGYISQMIIQIVAQGLILVVLFLACSRPGQYSREQRLGVSASQTQQPKSRNPSPTDARGRPVPCTVKKRRNSDTSVVKHKRATSKSEQQQRLLMNDSRRPSTEALNVSGTYTDLLIVEPTLPIWMDKHSLHKENDPPKKKNKKGRGRPELCRSQSNRVLTNGTNGMDGPHHNHKTHQKLSRKSSLASESSSAGLLFGVWEGGGPARVQDLPPSSSGLGRRATYAHDNSVVATTRRTVTPSLSASNGYHQNHQQGRHSSLPWLPQSTNGHERTNGVGVNQTTTTSSAINGCLPDLNPIGGSLSSFRTSSTAQQQSNLTMANGIRKGSVQKVYG